MSDGKMSLRQTIEPKSDQLNYDDLVAGPITLRVINLQAGSADQPVIVEVDRHRPFKPCKSMRRVMIAAWGDKGRDWIGKRMTLYGDPSVRFGGVEVGGIRISHVSGIDEPMRILLTTTRSKRSEYVVRPLADDATDAEPIKPAAEKRPEPAAPAESSRGPIECESLITGTLGDVTEKKLPSGSPKYDAIIDGRKYGFLSKTLRAQIEPLVGENVRAIVKESGKFWNLIDCEPAGMDAQPDTQPQADADGAPF